MWRATEDTDGRMGVEGHRGHGWEDGCGGPQRTRMGGWVWRATEDTDVPDQDGMIDDPFVIRKA